MSPGPRPLDPFNAEYLLKVTKAHNYVLCQECMMMTFIFIVENKNVIMRHHHVLLAM